LAQVCICSVILPHRSFQIPCLSLYTRMVIFSHLKAFVALAALVGIESARVARKRGREHASSKFIAGVPVHLKHLLDQQGGESEQEWLVVVNQGTSDDELGHLCKASRNGCNLVGHPSKGGVPFLKTRGTEQDLKNLIRAGDGVVRYVEPDHPVQVDPVVFMDSTSEVGVQAATWALDRIGADKRSTTGAGVTIFVMDTGVRVTHQEFENRASPAVDLGSNNGSLVECNGDQSCAADRHGHGTHCAGTAAGKTFGVAPAATVKAVKALNDRGGGEWSWVIAAMDWVSISTERPAVVSMSFAGDRIPVQAVGDAIDTMVNSGLIAVAAAGNTFDDACIVTPAYSPAAITVGATSRRYDTKADEVWHLSNFGRCVDIWAPGSSIESAWKDSDSQTKTISGTSMACPHVSGAAALLLEADPTKNTEAVRAALLDNSIKGVLAGSSASGPVVNNFLLYVGADGAPPSPPTTEPVTTPAPAPTPGPAPTDAPAPTPAPPPTPGSCFGFCNPSHCESSADLCSGCSFC